jgi:hypothetical protein
MDRRFSRKSYGGQSDSDEKVPRLYAELASWWPLLSSPADYVDESAFIRQTLIDACNKPPQTLLELGSGGGNNASHLKAHFRMTLVDRSPGMLTVSRRLNPECEHIEGDMRMVRLGRLFDAVFIHDGIMYMTTEQDLRKAMETARVHCGPGGVAVFVPDFVRENFAPETKHGGHDGGGRGMRYLEWTYDPDNTDNTFITDFAYLLREADGTVRVEYDRHILGLFARDVWLRLLRDAGFKPRIISDQYNRELFVGIRLADS